MAKKIQVSGYTETVRYNTNNGQIQYRPYNPDLVGLQLTSGGALFTMGNFAITTNVDPKLDKAYKTSGFSNFYSLDDLTINENIISVLNKRSEKTHLLLDKTKLRSYALFGSLTEYIRVSLENIIINWVGSLYITPFNGETYQGDTLRNIFYDSEQNLTSFIIPLSVVVNKFDINIKKGGTLANTYNESNKLRDLIVNFNKYVVDFNGDEYEIIDFNGYDDNTPYLSFTVRGKILTDNQISNGVNSLSDIIHIKPNDVERDVFFLSLNEFESHLLNRNNNYTAVFEVIKKTDSGFFVYTTSNVTWPVTDGYNIDFNTVEYDRYVTKLLEISNQYDDTVGNLISRFLVAENITSFDTLPYVIDGGFDESTGQKVTKLLNIYGRSFDEVNRYIIGLSNANNISYDKKDNIPNKFVRNLASTLGWDVSFDIINKRVNEISELRSEFKGLDLSKDEISVELWRRLILNTAWLWKTKGVRSGVEFLIKFIGLPDDLINFNEYVFIVKNNIDINLFNQILESNNLDLDLNNYPIDEDGYPRLLNNDIHYFQGNGGWYKETGGLNSNIDINKGNNPHIGAYDKGGFYFEQLTNILPDFQPTLIEGVTEVVDRFNHFNNYNQGTFDGYNADIFVEMDNDCYELNSSIIENPHHKIDECTCEPIEDNVLKLCLTPKENDVVDDGTERVMHFPVKEKETGLYSFSYVQYNMDGSEFKINGDEVLHKSYFTKQNTCKKINGTPTIMVVNKDVGFGCSHSSTSSHFSTKNWELTNTPIEINNDKFLLFFVEDKQMVVASDGSFCPSKWTVPVVDIQDPNFDIKGVGCKVTELGLQQYHIMKNYFTYRKNNNGHISAESYLNILLNNESRKANNIM